MKLPKGWAASSGEEVSVLITKGESPRWQGFQYQSEGALFVTSENVRDGRLDISQPKYISPAFHTKLRRSALKYDDILINLVGASIGRSCRFSVKDADANINQAVCLLRLKPGIDSAWVSLYLQEPSVVRRLIGNNGDSARANISLSDIRNFTFVLPPRDERRKIADILSTWDEALEKLDALIEAQERRKKALMQQLLTGRRRLKPHGVSIKHLKASEIFTNRSERNTGALPVLSVTQDQGIVLRSSLERRIAHDEDNINTYKVVRAGDYVISLRSFQGGLEYSEVTGAVSPAYHVIRPIKEIDQSFYRHYFKSTDFISRLAIATIGIRDGKQISFTDFGFIKLPYPAIEDQKRIGAILDTADQQLTLFRAQRSALDQQKRGLMQRLLTGQIRVRP